MLKTSALFSHSSYAAATAEAEAGFHQRACAFLRQHLGPAVAALDQAQLASFTHRALSDAEAYGAISAAQMLQYLVAAGSWGHLFATDAQYAPALARANWPRHDVPAPPQHMASALAALGREIDVFEAAIAADRQDLRRILAALNDIAAHSWQPEDAQLLPRAAAHVWPARARHLGATQVEQACHNALSACAQQVLTRAETAVLVCLAFPLGAGLLEDRLYPWLSRALDPQAENRAPALIAALGDHYHAAIRAAFDEQERTAP